MDDFVNSVKTCFQKYADFTGRAARPEFWWFVLFQVVVLFILGMVSQTLSSLASLAMLVPALAVGARRLHDIGKSGWLQLLGLIPIVGWIILIYWACQPGQPEANQYGAPPSTAVVPQQAAPGQQ
jgi:uncharacterized membrane protein YhaH (DUF805 family)